MMTKKDVPEDVVDGADSLMKLNSSKPTAEERKSIRSWKNTAADLFARFLRRKRSSTITTTPSCNRDPKTDKIKNPLVESAAKPRTNRKIGRCFDVGTRERMPFWLSRFMRDNNGVGPKMIIQKSITATDLKSNNGRLSMPFKKIVDMDFLTKEEETIIYEHFNKLREEGVDATLVDCELHTWEVNLRKWGMNNNNYVYNLVTSWNKVVEEIDLEEHDEIRLWSFHSNGRLYFALVLLPPESDSRKSNSGKRSSALVIHDKP